MAGQLGLRQNTHVATDVVPSADFNAKLENFAFLFSGGSIPTNATKWVKWQALKIPWACDIVYVSAWAAGVDTGGSIDIHEAGTTILSAPVNVQGQTHNQGTISDASIAADAELSLEVLAEGPINRLVVEVVVARD